LREGDHLPTVGTLQKLLNRTGATLTCDGSFGTKTKAAVKKFQQERHMGVDGVVGENTWPRISAGAGLPILDCVDIFDPSLLNLEVQDITRAGGSPIQIGGMSNAVEQAVTEILRRASRDTFLLRFHGHGAPGSAGIGTGHSRIGVQHRSAIDASNLAVIRPIVARLRGIFSRYGCVQFMHCSTGRGPQGKQVLQAIADDLGVPVSAGVFDQLGGGTTTFRFEGPTFTAVPSGGSLKSWCAALPDFPSMSVP
jgi:hypothetical protein